MLESVRSGWITVERTANPNASQMSVNRTVTVQRVSFLKSPDQSRMMETSSPAAPAASESRRTRFSWLKRLYFLGTGRERVPNVRVVVAGEFCLTAADSMFLQPTIEGTAAKAQGFGCLAYVTSISVDCFANQQCFYLVQTEFFHRRQAGTAFF